MKIAVWNIIDMVEEYGEDSVKEILSDFFVRQSVMGRSFLSIPILSTLSKIMRFSLPGRRFPYLT